jgi:hypothetical protein
MLIKHSDQNCLRSGAECDTCGKTEGTTYRDRYAIIAQGATGRWCEVMWICDVCGKAHEALSPAKSAEEARNTLPSGYADF